MWTALLCEECEKHKDTVPLWPLSDFTRRCEHRVKEPLRELPLEQTKIPCDGCGIPIPEPGEYPDPDALLCDRCYKEDK